MTTVPCPACGAKMQRLEIICETCDNNGERITIGDMQARDARVRADRAAMKLTTRGEEI